MDMDDENDLDNIFEEYENEDVQKSNNEPQNEENSAIPEAIEVQTREVVPVPKRVIRNPRLKFNAERLIGERGIPIVTKHFKNVKFKGKGHEKEDLNKLLSTLEHWSHRLFPSMKFEACLKQIEKLGKKRAVQTCLAKIRRDMPILASDFVHDEEEDEREEAQNETAFDLPQQDAFDRLFGESTETANLTSTPRNVASSGTALGSSFGGSLTEEQRQRMEYNKMLATERRKAKMAAMQADASADEDMPASTFEDSGRMSPSVLEPGCSKDTISNSALESSSNLDQQFESLFDEPNRGTLVQENLKKNDYESMCDDSENKISRTAKESTSNFDQQFESLFDEPNQGTLVRENLKKNYYESMCDDSNNNHEDTDMQPTCDESEKNLRELLHDSETNLHESASEDLKESHQESSLQEDTAMDQCKSNQADSVTNPHDSINGVSKTKQDESGSDDLKESHQESALQEDTTVDQRESNQVDSVTNHPDSINDVSKTNQCGSKNGNSENDAEELGLDELMDLVDDTTST